MVLTGYICLYMDVLAENCVKAQRGGWEPGAPVCDLTQFGGILQTVGQKVDSARRRATQGQDPRLIQIEPDWGTVRIPSDGPFEQAEFWG